MFRQLLPLPTFPSPCGDYGSYHLRTASEPGRPDEVSVPLRGLWFLSAVSLHDEHGTSYIVVSVPLRGLWFLSIIRVHFCNAYVDLFPSPCGDYGSYPTTPRSIRPPTMTGRFPSPCGDYGSYRQQGEHLIGLWLCFRPLAGIMVLI